MKPYPLLLIAHKSYFNFEMLLHIDSCLDIATPTIDALKFNNKLYGQLANCLCSAASGLIGVSEVSTHSFRRTALTQMHNAGIPLRDIQKISGHNDLGTLQRYLEVSPE